MVEEGASVLTRPVVMFRTLLAILLPPVSVYARTGMGRAFWLNLLLTLLGYVPGVVHALRINRK